MLSHEIKVFKLCLTYLFLAPSSFYIILVFSLTINEKKDVFRSIGFLHSSDKIMEMSVLNLKKRLAILQDKIFQKNSIVIDLNAYKILILNTNF